MLEIKNISYHIDGFSILKNVELKVESGEIVGLIGPNGSGKTTLFNILSGFIKQSSGTIYYAANDISTLSARRRSLAGFGRLWQDVRLFNKMTVWENLFVALKNNPGDNIWANFFKPKEIGFFKDAVNTKIEKYLEMIGLLEKRNVEVENLSFGQQKLIAISRLLLGESEILLLDEPFAGVNEVLIRQIQQIIMEQKKLGKTILIIEHNIAKIVEIADRLYALDEGAVICHGTPVDVMNASVVRESYAGI